jgi:hypothetical protein
MRAARPFGLLPTEMAYPLRGSVSAGLGCGLSGGRIGAASDLLTVAASLLLLTIISATLIPVLEVRV